jgi:hypothetical protein
MTSSPSHDAAAAPPTDDATPMAKRINERRGLPSAICGCSGEE